MSNKILPIRPKRKFESRIYVYCEGDQEKEYFEHIRNLLNNCPDNKVKLKIILKNCSGGNPKIPVLTANKNNVSPNEIFVVFDYDNKQVEFEEAIDLAVSNKFKVGYSNINFDYWLALHKLTSNKISYGTKTNNNSYVNELKKVYNLSANDDIKQHDVIMKILSQINLDDVMNAIQNCELIENYHQTNSQRINTQKGNYYYDNPDIKVYLLVKRLMDISL